MIFRSPFPDVIIPDMALTPFVFEKAQRLGSKPAIIDALSGRSLSFVELYEKVSRVAEGFRQRGVQKHDVVAILAPNLPEYAIAFHAAAILGAAVTTVNPLCNHEELAKQLKDSRASLIVTVPELKTRVTEASADLPIKAVYVIGGQLPGEAFESLYDCPALASTVSINPRDDLAALPYSSGTTGLSKGVMLTHYNLVANISQMSVTEHIGEGDVLLGVLPFFHIYGLVVILNMGLRQGATIVTMARFDLEHMLKAIAEYKITFAHIVPPIVLALSKHPAVETHDHSSLRAIMSAAAPLSADMAELCAKRLGCVVKQGWGMTETSPAVTMCEPFADEIKPGSVGRPIPNTELKVVHTDTGLELGPAENGELLVRGPQIMKGYLNRAEATAEILDQDGWLRTGDIGYADADGFFFIVDRAKELIKYKGFQVAPAELEAVLLTHPAVADAAVIPIPDSEAGEIPKAIVVLREIASEEELMEYVADRVARYKRIRKIEFADEIPKSASGKILRRLLVNRERAKPERS